MRVGNYPVNIYILRFSSGMQLKYPIYGINPVETMDKYINTVISATEFCKKECFVLKNSIIVSFGYAGDPIALTEDGTLNMFLHDNWEINNWVDMWSFLDSILPD